MDKMDTARALIEERFGDQVQIPKGVSVLFGVVLVDEATGRVDGNYFLAANEELDLRPHFEGGINSILDRYRRQEHEKEIRPKHDPA